MPKHCTAAYKIMRAEGPLFKVHLQCTHIHTRHSTALQPQTNQPKHQVHDTSLGFWSEECPAFFLKGQVHNFIKLVLKQQAGAPMNTETCCSSCSYMKRSVPDALSMKGLGYATELVRTTTSAGESVYPSCSEWPYVDNCANFQTVSPERRCWRVLHLVVHLRRVTNAFVSQTQCPSPPPIPNANCGWIKSCIHILYHHYRFCIWSESVNLQYIQIKSPAES